MEKATETIEGINYEPRGDRVVVRTLPPPVPKEGEMVVPRSQQKKPLEGIVIAVGPGLRNRATGELIPVELKPGDRVLFLEYAGSTIEVDGVEYLSMRDEEIHGRRKLGHAVP